MTSSLKLSDGDFDAYLPERAASNAWSRPRIEVKQRALAWARRVLARLAALGLELDVDASDEHPSIRNRRRVEGQWVFFLRDERARDELDRLIEHGRSIAATLDEGPFTRHAFLALRIDAEAVEVCFAVHPDATVDRENLRARLAEDASSSERASDLVAALHALPEQLAVGTVRGDRTPASATTLDELRALVDRAAASRAPFWIGWSVERATAIEHADILDEQLEDALVALAPLYRLVAWSRDNDLVGFDARLAHLRDERARTHAEMTAETARWQAERAQAEERSRELSRARQASVPGARATLETLFRGRDASSPSAAPLVEPDRPAPARAPAHGPSASGHIEKGTRVRVLSGPFTEKVGVVSELDGRGGARVLLGLLAARVDLGDLEPVVEGRERPPLQSSHRRPTYSASRKAR